MSAKGQRIPFPKFENASLTSWSLTYSGRNNVTKLDSFPFPRGSARRFSKLRIISLYPKRLWISVTCNFSLALFDSKIKMNFEEEILYRVPIFETLSVSKKLSDSRSFQQGYFSFTWAAFSSSRDLRHTSLVRKLFEPSSGGSKFSEEVKSQFYFEGKTIIVYYTSLMIAELMLFLLWL